jgi:hypothetical protein
MRMKLHRDPLTADGPHTAAARGPQAAFLGFLVLFTLYTLYDTSQLTFLGKVFPVSVALILLALLASVVAVYARKKEPSYLFYDSEHGGEPLMTSDFYQQGWILALLALVGVFGFVLGTFVYITLFLRLRAKAAWHWAMIGALGAVLVLAALSQLLVLQYPQGLLQAFVDMPWPFD